MNKSDVNGGGRSKSSTSTSSGWNWLTSNKNKNEKESKPITIIGDVINHGKLPYWDPKKSIHYHATLQAGENTLEAQLARVLMKTIVLPIW